MAYELSFQETELVKDNISNCNCNGCLSYLIYVFHNSNRMECKYTTAGTNNLTNCPCKKCLVKVVCNEICENFIRVNKRSVDLAGTYDLEKYIYKGKK